MPITPFHGGIGLALKGPLKRRFSFSLFVCTQIAIDLEPAFYILRRELPLHRAFHTLLGATIVSVAVAFAARPLCSSLLRLLRRHLHSPPHWLDLTPEISSNAALTTAFIGAAAHVFPDAIMHRDVEPFAPLTSANPFHALVSLGTLHLALVGAGIFGIALLMSGRHKLLVAIPLLCLLGLAGALLSIVGPAMGHAPLHEVRSPSGRRLALLHMLDEGEDPAYGLQLVIAPAGLWYPSVRGTPVFRGRCAGSTSLAWRSELELALSCPDPTDVNLRLSRHDDIRIVYLTPDPTPARLHTRDIWTGEEFRSIPTDQHDRIPAGMSRPAPWQP